MNSTSTKSNSNNVADIATVLSELKQLHSKFVEFKTNKTIQIMAWLRCLALCKSEVKQKVASNNTI